MIQFLVKLLGFECGGFAKKLPETKRGSFVVVAETVVDQEEDADE